VSMAFGPFPQYTTLPYPYIAARIRLLQGNVLVFITDNANDSETRWLHYQQQIQMCNSRICQSDLIHCLDLCIYLIS